LVADDHSGLEIVGSRERGLVAGTGNKLRRVNGAALRAELHCCSDSRSWTVLFNHIAPALPFAEASSAAVAGDRYNQRFISLGGRLVALDEKIYQQRREKLAQIEALGQQAYPYRYQPSHTIPEVLERYGNRTAEQLQAERVEVNVAGRIMAIRAMGKAAFLLLQQGGRQLQIYVKKDAVGEKGFELYKLLDIGDHIGARGYLFRTKTGELTVHVDELTFLVKALLPLPEKWHGLTDVELRYRQRYADMFMNPEVREVFVKRSRVVQSLRCFFDSRGFVEVETPMLQPLYGGAT